MYVARPDHSTLLTLVDIAFTCHILKLPLRPKAHLFDPTPPVKPAHKVALIHFFVLLLPQRRSLENTRYNRTVLERTSVPHTKRSKFPALSSSGSFASVFLAIDSENYRQVACKTLNIRPHPKQSAPEAEKKKVLKEANLLKSLCHVCANNPASWPSRVF